MRVQQWCATRQGQQLTGVRRYEQELFTHLRRQFAPQEGWDLSRAQRHPGTLRGSTFASWLFSYAHEDADIVHATEETLSPASYLRDTNKFVVTCHGLIPMRYPSTIEDVTSRVLWKLVPRALQRADRVIAVSEFTKDEIQNLLGLSADLVDVVHHGVDHDMYRPMDGQECKRRFDLNPERYHILIVSSNLEQKRMDLARRAFDKLREERDDVRLLKAGYGETLSGDGVISPGWVDESDMPALYNAADVYFHPSEYESFGLPLLEAMACGTPVVTSNRASIPEVTGGAAVLLNPDADDAGRRYADAISDKLDVGVDEDAVERSKDFTWHKTAEETCDVYKRSLGV